MLDSGFRVLGTRNASPVPFGLAALEVLSANTLSRHLCMMMLAEN